MGLLGYMVVLFLVFWEMSIPFYTLAAPIHIPIHSVRGIWVCFWPSPSGRWFLLCTGEGSKVCVSSVPVTQQHLFTTCLHGHSGTWVSCSRCYFFILKPWYLNHHAVSQAPCLVPSLFHEHQLETCEKEMVSTCKLPLYLGLQGLLRYDVIPQLVFKNQDFFCCLLRSFPIHLSSVLWLTVESTVMVSSYLIWQEVWRYVVPMGSAALWCHFLPLHSAIFRKCLCDMELVALWL